MHINGIEIIMGKIVRDLVKIHYFVIPNSVTFHMHYKKLLRVPTHIEQKVKGLFFHKTTSTYICTFVWLLSA